MPYSQNFHDTMALWLKTQGLAAPSGARDEVYSLAFGPDLRLYVCLLHESRVDVFAEAGPLHNRNAVEVVTALFALNRFSPYEPCVNVGLDEASGQVFVWTNIPLAEFAIGTMDNATQQVHARVSQARALLAGSGAGAKPQARPREATSVSSAALLANLKRRP